MLLLSSHNWPATKAVYRRVLPVLQSSNLICQSLDAHLLKAAKKYKLDYTRYADDLTFLTNDRHFVENQKKFLAEAIVAITKAGFSINEKENPASI